MRGTGPCAHSCRRRTCAYCDHSDSAGQLWTRSLCSRTADTAQYVRETGHHAGHLKLTRDSVSPEAGKLKRTFMVMNRSFSDGSGLTSSDNRLNKYGDRVGLGFHSNRMMIYQRNITKGEEAGAPGGVCRAVTTRTDRGTQARESSADRPPWGP